MVLTVDVHSDREISRRRLSRVLQRLADQDPAAFEMIASLALALQRRKIDRSVKPSKLA